MLLEAMLVDTRSAIVASRFRGTSTFFFAPFAFLICLTLSRPTSQKDS